MSITDAKENTDRELWREREGDFYSPALFVTQGGGIFSKTSFRLASGIRSAGNNTAQRWLS